MPLVFPMILGHGLEWWVLKHGMCQREVLHWRLERDLKPLEPGM